MIASVTVNPGFGVAGLQQFSFAAIASDPDNDSLTYAWDLAGNARTGANASLRSLRPRVAGLGGEPSL